MAVQVIPYNPEWKEWFNELRNQIWPQISDLVIDIVHVGSTSIEGMSAKPIIDIDIVLDSMNYFEAIKARLSRLGYIHQGDLGIKGREAFKLDYDPKIPHHLYLCPVDSSAYRNHSLLKKHLTENPDAFKRYNDLKLGLSKTADSIDSYWRSKTLLILEFLEKEGLSEDELDSIRKDNL
jgi:GrpB-like predicted nucleotidyltransferase (UPF0157 family)